ncbi:SHOCT domain-containing protein [Thermodesulfobacteriota bacterium]
MTQKNNFRFRFLVLLAALLVLSVYTTHAARAAEGDQKVNWLFVMTATSGSYDGKTITLHNVPPTLMFSDRPYRIFGHMDTPKLIKEVSTGPDNFAENPPNAVLSTFGGGLPTAGTVVLYKPTLTGNTISFPVKVLEGNIPDKFEGATLFIDHWHHHGHHHGHPHWHPHVGAFVVGAAVGSAVTHHSETKTVVVKDPNYYYQGSAPPPSDKHSTKNTESRLEEVKSLYDKGLISKSEYDQKREKILNDV